MKKVNSCRILEANLETNSVTKCGCGQIKLLFLVSVSSTIEREGGREGSGTEGKGKRSFQF